MSSFNFAKTLFLVKKRKNLYYTASISGENMNPLFQGKIDNFCAAYSVLNALRLICGISAFQARDILNDMFMEQAKNAEEWKKIVCHETTYCELVRSMLEKWKNAYNYGYYCPFPCDKPNIAHIKTFSPEVDVDTVWDFLKDAIKDKQTTAVMRFCRFLPHQAGPIVDHWSTVLRVTDREIFLYDCSLEPTGWYVLHRDKFFAAPFGAIPPQKTGLENQFVLNLGTEEFGVLCPESIFVLERKATAFDTIKTAFKRKIFTV